MLFILIVTTPKTTFIHEECWVHLFVPIFYYGGRKYFLYKIKMIRLSKTVGSLNPSILMASEFVTYFSS